MITAQQIIEGVLGPVQWQEGGMGYATCPGEKAHTTKNAERDCRVMVSPANVFVHCFHNHCGKARGKARMEILARMEEAARNKVLDGDFDASAFEAEAEKHKERRAIIRKAHERLPAVVAEFEWDPVSPAPIPDNPLEQFRMLIRLFDRKDIVWCGGLYDSGQDWHKSRFRPAARWAEITKVPHPFICPSVFKPGSVARTAGNLAARRFLVTESDTLSREHMAAVANWLNQQEGFQLRALVDTGGKSLHAWFDWPGDERAAELRPILTGFECDPALWRPGQPVRAPGYPRGEKMQSLVYYDGRGN